MKKLFLFSTLCALLTLTAGCGDNRGEGEKMGEKMDKAVEELKK